MFSLGLTINHILIHLPTFLIEYLHIISPATLLIRCQGGVNMPNPVPSHIRGVERWLLANERPESGCKKLPYGPTGWGVASG